MYWPAALGVIVEPARVMGGRRMGVEETREVIPLKTMAEAEGAREMVVEKTVMAEPPGERVCPPTMYWPARLGVIAAPPMVRIAGDVGMTLIAEVTPLIITAEAEGAREMVLPLTVIAEPGFRVWLSTTY